VCTAPATVRTSPCAVSAGAQTPAGTWPIAVGGRDPGETVQASGQGGLTAAKPTRSSDLSSNHPVSPERARKALPLEYLKIGASANAATSRTMQPFTVDGPATTERPQAPPSNPSNSRHIFQAAFERGAHTERIDQYALRDVALYEARQFMLAAH
jgi:hypothetical protein